MPMISACSETIKTIEEHPSIKIMELVDWPAKIEKPVLQTSRNERPSKKYQIERAASFTVC